jgi:hypothetical protein
VSIAAVYLIQMLLPRKGADGAPLDESIFRQTRAELVETFAGVTAYLRSPAQGAWVAPDGRVESDDVIMVEVLTDTFDRGWWREYGKQLAVRFGQETIHIRALPAETPDTPDPHT